jgi:hypothetical protein
LKRKIIKSGAIITVAMLIAGCSAKGPQFSGFSTPTNGKSNVYLYRDSSMLGGGVAPDIHELNVKTSKDIVLGHINRNGYILTTVNPGEYKFWAKTEARNEVDIQTKPNKVYCIKHYITAGFFVGHPQFKLVDMKTCKEEIQDTHLMPKEEKQQSN